MMTRSLSEHLHAIDADVHVRRVVGLGVGRAGDHQPPGDQRRRLARPAGLDRQAAEIDVGAEPALGLAVRPRRPGSAGSKAPRGPSATGSARHARRRTAAGSRKRGQHLAEFADARRRERRIPAATRSAVPNRLASTGILAPCARSRTGAPDRRATRTRRWTSVISWTRLTGSADSRQKPAFFEKAEEGAKIAKGGKVAERHCASSRICVSSCIDIDQSARRIL